MLKYFQLFAYSPYHSLLGWKFALWLITPARQHKGQYDHAFTCKIRDNVQSLTNNQQPNTKIFLCS